MLYESLPIPPSHLVALFSIFTPIYVVLINAIRKRQFLLQYVIAALLSVCGAAVIKVQGLPSGDFWTGFALMQIAGIAFAFGQIAYRDWKHTHSSVPDSAIFALLTLGGTLCAGLFSFALADKSLSSHHFNTMAIHSLPRSCRFGLRVFSLEQRSHKDKPGYPCRL